MPLVLAMHCTGSRGVLRRWWWHVSQSVRRQICRCMDLILVQGQVLAERTFAQMHGSSMSHAHALWFLDCIVHHVADTWRDESCHIYILAPSSDKRHSSMFYRECFSVLMIPASRQDHDIFLPHMLLYVIFASLGAADFRKLRSQCFQSLFKSLSG